MSRTPLTVRSVSMVLLLLTAALVSAPSAAQDQSDPVEDVGTGPIFAVGIPGDQDVIVYPDGTGVVILLLEVCNVGDTVGIPALSIVSGPPGWTLSAPSAAQREIAPDTSVVVQLTLQGPIDTRRGLHALEIGASPGSSASPADIFALKVPGPLWESWEDPDAVQQPSSGADDQPGSTDEPATSSAHSQTLQQQLILAAGVLGILLLGAMLVVVVLLTRKLLRMEQQLAGEEPRGTRTSPPRSKTPSRWTDTRVDPPEERGEWGL